MSRCESHRRRRAPFLCRRHRDAHRRQQQAERLQGIRPHDSQYATLPRVAPNQQQHDASRSRELHKAIANQRLHHESSNDAAHQNSRAAPPVSLLSRKRANPCVACFPRSVVPGKHKCSSAPVCSKAEAAPAPQ